jgi:sugar transferase EpsL
VKRFFDIVISLLALLILSPMMAAIAVLVCRKLGRPIVFRQIRPGLHARPFELRKFRTMTDERGTDGDLLSDSERLTRFGRFLRSTSLDELPELWNVLRGDMSLVGPRPLLMEYVGLYSEEQARRQQVRPGITGWAQVKGRNALTWEEKFELDVWYVENQSLWLDLKILFMTMVTVFKREGVSHDGHATMDKFRGSAE